jgi:hypothetical protein
MLKSIMETSSKELQKKTGIYLLSISNNIYVGSSINLYARLIEHRTDLKNNRHGNDYLQRAVNKYKIENLKFKILSFCKPEERLQKEKEFILSENANLNLIKDPTIKKMTDYSKKKLSNSVKKGRSEGRYENKYSFMPVEHYDYRGNYVQSFKNSKEAAEKLNLNAKRVIALLNGYRKGVASKGIRLRYSNGVVPPLKFELNPKSLSRNLEFYSENDSEKIVFKGLRDMYDFLLQSVIDGKQEITIKYKQKIGSQLGPL